MQLRATFTVDEIDHGEPIANHPGAEVARARVHKTFSGALEGRGTVEMTTALAPAGRGYVGVEWIEGSLDGRRGGFALLHLGTAGEDDQDAVWWVVPGSGVGELAGITGTADIVIDEAGVHHLTLDVEMP